MCSSRAKGERCREALRRVVFAVWTHPPAPGMRLSGGPASGRPVPAPEGWETRSARVRGCRRVAHIPGQGSGTPSHAGHVALGGSPATGANLDDLGGDGGAGGGQTLALRLAARRSEQAGRYIETRAHASAQKCCALLSSKRQQVNVPLSTRVGLWSPGGEPRERLAAAAASYASPSRALRCYSTTRCGPGGRGEPDTRTDTVCGVC